MRLIGPRLRTVRHWLGTCMPCAMVCAGLLFAALPIRAQDVAEAARQERARKAAEQKSRRHVYTNDDLKRERILTPSDEARAEARKKNLPAPASDPQPAMDANTNSAAGSLGEIARRYRKEKAAREAEEALKKQPAQGYPMNVPAPAYGAPKILPSPKPPAVLRREIRPPVFRDRISRSAPPNPAPNSSVAFSAVAPRVSANAPRDFATPRRPLPRRRISPFEPRPYVAPIMPGPPPRALGVPSAPPAPMVEIPRGKLKGVMVKAGDSWWKLSREFLGRGSRWRELLALNPGQTDPNFLAAGSEILVPATGDSPPKPPDKLLKVQEGDTLWGIAHARYGSGAAWTCLARANAQLSDPNRIFPGQELVLPRSCQRTP